MPACVAGSMLGTSLAHGGVRERAFLVVRVELCPGDRDIKER